MALRDNANAPQHADEARAPGFRNRRQSEEKFRELMENPEYQKLMAVEQKGRLDFAYAALFKKLGLTPTQLEKFKELLAEKQASFSDVFTAASAQGLDPRTDPQGFRALVKSAQDDIDSSIRAALGDTAAGLLKVNRVLLRGITFSTGSSDFSSFTEVGLTIKPRFGTEIPLGTVTAAGGLGDTFTVPASGDIDLLALLNSTNCLSATLTLTGRTPTENLDLTLVAKVDVEAQVSL